MMMMMMIMVVKVVMVVADAYDWNQLFELTTLDSLFILKISIYRWKIHQHLSGNWQLVC